MDQQQAPKDRQKALRGDFLFACSMLVIYFGFVTSLMGMPIWGMIQARRQRSASATVTAQAIAT